MIDVTGPYPPAIYQSLDGKTYAAAGSKLVEVPKGTNRDQLNWSVPKLVINPNKNKIIATFVSSRDSNQTYSIQTNGYNTWCNCLGYMFRKNCKHLKSLKFKNYIFIYK